MPLTGPPTDQEADVPLTGPSPDKPVWDRVRIALDVLRAEQLVMDWAAGETNDAALANAAERLRVTIAELDQHPQLQAPPAG
jgi:hypothetical protein